MSDPNICPWSEYQSAAITFCEQRLCGWIVEPANTWSNIGYLIASILILRDNHGRNRHSLSLIGITALFVGIGSTLFHATGTRWGEVVDVSAMYLISGLFVTFALKQLVPLTRLQVIGVFSLLSGSSILYLVSSHSNGIVLFGLQLVLMGALEIRIFRKKSPRSDYRNLILMAGAFAFSYICWYLDFHRIICNEHNHILGGHALWHLSNATCLWSYYKYQEQFYRTALDQAISVKEMG
jgi:hypothetical protein